MRLNLMISVLLVCAASGCASKKNRPAPLEERRVATPFVGRSGPAASLAPGSAPSAVATASALAKAADPNKVLPGAEHAGKPGYYSVKPSDTLIRIGLETDQNWRDLIKWNNLENANAIEVGQVLRVAAPGTELSAVSARPVPSTKVESRALDIAVKPDTAKTEVNKSVPPAVVAVTPTIPPTAASGVAVQAITGASAKPPTSTAVEPVAPTVAAASTTGTAAQELTWQWPVAGPVLVEFQEAVNKGVSLGGKAGAAVLAAADGKVAYAGSGLRGYGNVVIIKHGPTYISAYAHNQKLLAKTDQLVRRGQKIAEMGSTDSDKVQLHFEIRKLGKPIDPAKLLPAR
jgi:lipoprotein NlpD